MIRSLRSAGALLVVALGLSACAPVPVRYQPSTSLAERDDLHRKTPVPPIEADAEFITNVVEADVAIPPEPLLSWIANVPLERVLLGTKAIAPVIRTDPLSPQWGVAGARRRVVFRDGNTALEQIDLIEPARYRYVVWNFTNDGRRAVQYAVGEFRVSPTPQGAHVVWTYRFRGRGWPTTGFLRSFVERDYRVFMQEAMDRMRLESIKDLASTGSSTTTPAISEGHIGFAAVHTR